MSIRSSKDLADALFEGRFHIQRFLKNAGSTGDSHWQDWSYASGQPAYDARIGDALSFTPMVAAGNDAVYFPSMDSGQERKLIELAVYTTAGGTGQLTVDYQMHDLLGVYPLIDGDSTDQQLLDNTQTLPRYATGAGVQMVLVNHIAPAITAGCLATINYVDMNNTARSTQVYTATYGVGKASWALNTAGTSTGPLYIPIEGGGVKSITDITFATPPGGLWCLYLVQPISYINWQGGLAAVTQTVFTEKNSALVDSFSFPTIYDGAWLGFFYMPNGSSRSVATFGTATFVWG